MPAGDLKVTQHKQRLGIGGGEKSADNEEFCRAVFKFLWEGAEEEA